MEDKHGNLLWKCKSWGRSSRWGCPWANYLPFLQYFPQDPISYRFLKRFFKTITADFPSPCPAAVTLMYEYQSRHHGCRQHTSIVLQPCKSEVGCHSVLENFTGSTGSLDEERQGEREYLPLNRHVDLSAVTSRLQSCNVIHLPWLLALKPVLVKNTNRKWIHTLWWIALIINFDISNLQAWIT